MEITNEQKQVMLSGLLGDGSLYENGTMTFSCVHRDYLELKKNLLGELCTANISESVNRGYKEAPVFRIHCKASSYGKKLLDYTHQDIVNELDELGLALWMFDDGSRHKTGNFYNISTHAIDRNIEEKVLLPFFNKLGIYPNILTEAKKDGRVFSYLYISKWRGAVLLSRMMRELNLGCYDYKLLPVELENTYFKLENNEEFKNASTRRKTNLIKEYLKIPHSDNYFNNITSIEMQK